LLFKICPAQKKRRLQYDDIPQASDPIPLNTIKDAKNALNAEFYDFVTTSICKVQPMHDREIDDNGEKFWENQEQENKILHKLFDGFLKRTRVPRGILQRIEDKSGLRRNSFSDKFKKKFKYVDLWEQFITDDFRRA
ncbi:hypothetical protein DFQ29_003835, partial [Apophysomyces sp. BC1021]